MLQNQQILIWVIFLASLAGYTYVQQEQQNINEDPTSCILNYLDEQRSYLSGQALDEVFSFDGSYSGLSLDSDLAQKNLSLLVLKNEKILYRSHSIDGEQVCDVLVISPEINLKRCIGLFETSGKLNNNVTSQCQLVQSYKLDKSDGIPFFLNDKEVYLKGFTQKTKKTGLWILFPFFTSLFLLLLIPFKLQDRKNSMISYSVLGLILASYFMGAESALCSWFYPISSFVLFACLYVWRNEHFIKNFSLSQRLVMYWGLSLFPFILALFVVKDHQHDIFSNNPFESLNIISYKDFGIILSMVLLMLAHLIGMHQTWNFTKKKFPNKNQHFTLFGALGVLHLGVILATLNSFPIIPIVLGIATYFLLIDLFTEIKQNPVIWTILWTVFLSIIIAGTVYFNDFSKAVFSVKEKIASQELSVDKGSLKSYTNNTVPEYFKSEIQEFNNVGIQSFYKDNQIHFVNNLSNGQLEVVSFNIPGFIKAVTLFSSVFILGIFVYFLLTLLHRRWRLLPKFFFPGEIYMSSFRRRIQFSYLILTIISFIGIALITIILLNNYFKSNERQSLRNSLHLVKAQVEFIAESNHEVAFKDQINDIRSRYAFDLSVFDKNGYNVEDKGLFLSSAMMSYLDKNEDSSLSKTQSEKGFNSYITIKNDAYPYAFISGIDRPASSKVSIYDFIAGILNVYVFLFIIAITFGLFISKSIVDPLSRLSKQMRQLRLGKNNQQIEWEGEGEVGELINNYNAMVQKLEESASLIAHTERDMAWREMARQVAHEIKNPLTPMKLQLQFLQRQVNANVVPEKGHLNRISATLLEQIENLSNISEAFSNVAKLPKATNEKVILNEVVESVHDLFRKREDMNIRLSEPINDLIVFADKNHLIRILNNIVKNAIEAIPEDRLGEINISLYKHVNDAIIKVSDNGIGIPFSMRDKIFTPKFTTKNSGSGLGLAIAANMAESFNGRIYFKTREEAGTDFFIQIPMMRLTENKEGNRVVLE